MYQPPHNVENRQEVIHKLIREQPLGLLISSGQQGLLANPIPFVLHGGNDLPTVLECHVAIANPQWRDFENGGPCLVVFQGPQAYVTPNWYPAKQEHGKVVPTWNYVIVQARGTARTISDREWYLKHLNELTDQSEASVNEGWKVSDAPATYVDALMKGIKGIRIEVTELAGKWKTSQNRSRDDRHGVVDGLEQHGPEAQAVASIMRTQLTESDR